MCQCFLFVSLFSHILGDYPTNHCALRPQRYYFKREIIFKRCFPTSPFPWSSRLSISLHVEIHAGLNVCTVICTHHRAILWLLMFVQKTSSLLFSLHYLILVPTLTEKCLSFFLTMTFDLRWRFIKLVFSLNITNNIENWKGSHAEQRAGKEI